MVVVFKIDYIFSNILQLNILLIDKLISVPPISQISLVEPKEPRLLREDEDAVLLCSADSSPPAYNFTFYKGAEVRKNI